MDNHDNIEITINDNDKPTFKFLKRDDLEKTKIIKPSKYQTAFEIKKISANRDFDIRKMCTNNGKFDSDKWNDQIIIESICAPDLSNAEAQKEFGVITQLDLLKSLLTLGEYLDLQRAVLEFNGFTKPDAELIDDAKN